MHNVFKVVLNFNIKLWADKNQELEKRISPVANIIFIFMNREHKQ